MSIFITDGPIAICDRCRTKKLRRELSPDRDKPGLLVCRECNDVRDPWRQPWHPKDADIHVDRPRPEQPLKLPTTQTGVDDLGHVVEVPLSTEITQSPVPLSISLSASGGAFALFGHDAHGKAHDLTADGGIYAYFGRSAGFDLGLGVTTGAYVLTGHAVADHHVYSMSAVGTSFLLTGHDAVMTRTASFVMSAAKGAFALTGHDAGMSLAASFVMAASTGVHRVNAPEFGVFRWDPTAMDNALVKYEKWFPRQNVKLCHTFPAYSTWTQIEGESWLAPNIASWIAEDPNGYRNALIALPMLPGDGVSTLANLAAGAYDSHFTAFANYLATNGLMSCYLRVGWEMDGNGWPWSAPPDVSGGNATDRANWKAGFRRVVNAMRAAQPTNKWKFVFNTTNNNWDGTVGSSYLDEVWPGDDVVDLVAIDMYDQSWVPSSYPYPGGADAATILACQEQAWTVDHVKFLNWIRDFGKVHNKPMAIPEWGVVYRSDGHGGLDDPYFIQQMHDYIMDPANNVQFHAYWGVSAADIDSRFTDVISGQDDVNYSGETRFPDSAIKFKDLFTTNSVVMYRTGKTYWIDNQSGTRQLAPTDPVDSTDSMSISFGVSNEIVYEEPTNTAVNRQIDGTYVINIPIVTGAPGCKMRVYFERVDAGGTIQNWTESSGWLDCGTDGQQLTFYLPNPFLGTWLTTDRLALVIHIRNWNTGGTATVTWSTGVAGAKVITPFE